MRYDRTLALDKLLTGYKRYYNITRFDGALGIGDVREAETILPPALPPGNELTAVCEYYERSGQHLFLKSNELWSANQEEFIFLFSISHLTKDLYECCRDYAYEAGMDMAHIGKGHMYTYISPIFVCDSADEDAKRALKKCGIYKSFLFSFHGWMEFHNACVDLSEKSLHFNRRGQCMKKNMTAVLQALLQKEMSHEYACAAWG
ncbi:MAG: hypothetical protein SPI25_06880 [Dialister sp.]|nr:hypothetical protein [Dialister sp.]